MKSPKPSFAQFLRQDVWWQHPTQGIIKCPTDDYIFDLAKVYQYHILVEVLKSRQMGLTWLNASYCAYKFLCEKNQNMIIVSKRDDEAQAALNRVRFVLDNVRPEVKAYVHFAIDKADKSNTSELEQKNKGNRIKSASGSAKEPTRGEAASLVILDEFAFYEWADKAYAAAVGSVSEGGQLLITSTPNGQNEFFSLWTAAAEKGFTPMTVHFSLRPDRDAAWEARTRASISSSQFAQEYDCNFLQSGNPVFDMGLIKLWE